MEVHEINLEDLILLEITALGTYPGLIEMVLKVDRPKLLVHCPPFLKNLVKDCWSSEATSHRPNFGVICEKLKIY